MERLKDAKEIDFEELKRQNIERNHGWRSAFSPPMNSGQYLCIVRHESTKPSDLSFGKFQVAVRDYDPRDSWANNVGWIVIYWRFLPPYPEDLKE